MSTMSVQASSAYLAMPDAVNVNLLPAGYPAYLGYADGNFRTAKQLAGMFPEAQLVILTVNGSTDAAHGARVSPGEDVEPGDLTAAAAAAWAARQLSTRPGMPGAPGIVMYASVIGKPGYGMRDLLGALGHAGILRTEVRLLSAHYGAGPHICGPGTCGAIPVGMDGTQWTNAYQVPGGVIDMSMLNPGFFQNLPNSTETERIVRELGIVRQGDQGAAVRTVQALCNARDLDHGVTVGALTVDGVFGIKTLSAVKFLQSLGKVTMDGVVGPATWPVLLGVA